MSPGSHTGRVRPLLSGVVLRAQSDARLARLAGEGHQAAFSVIFERYERELRAHAARVVRPSRVDDVVQHAMLSAWSSLLEGTQIDQLRPWLHRIVHNAALNTTTRRGYEDGELPRTFASAARTEDLVQDRLTAGEALTAIAALPAAQRHALMLTAIDGHSAREAAAHMGVSENALRQLVYRARTTMRSAVSAITPLPLLLSATGHAAAGPATVAGAGALGSSSLTAAAAAGGGSAAVKAAAILAIAAGALGTTTALHHDRAPHHTQTTHAASLPATAPSRQPSPIAARDPAPPRHRSATPGPHAAITTSATSRRTALRQRHGSSPDGPEEQHADALPHATQHESTSVPAHPSSEATQSSDSSPDPVAAVTDASEASTGTTSTGSAPQETDPRSQDSTDLP